jgi:hypothetical protein
MDCLCNKYIPLGNNKKIILPPSSKSPLKKAKPLSMACLLVTKASMTRSS